jgi:hypothetical protein
VQRKEEEEMTEDTSPNDAVVVWAPVKFLFLIFSHFCQLTNCFVSLLGSTLRLLIATTKEAKRTTEDSREDE